MTVPTEFQAMPFGQTITADDVLESLDFLDDWEDRYGYIIDLGKELPPMPDECKTDANFVQGCQSQVWVDASFDDNNNRLHFLVDSDALIVKGLAAIVMSIFNAKSPQDIVNTDIEPFFEQIKLLQHLSPTRGNGLKSMVAKIKNIAAQQAH